jgi:glycosyltransferase involved in cell wall biosynthesis
MPASYAAADCLVLPSDGHETWGLVVNEAMACGRPAVITDPVGCREDLVDDTTGGVVPLGDVPRLADALVTMAARLRKERSTIQTAVQTRIAGFTCAQATQGTLEAIEFVLARRDQPSRAPAACLPV